MPANTPLGYPYPVGTDRVADGDDAIHELALAVEGKVGVFRSGMVAVATPDTAAAFTAVTFPVGLFTAIPNAGAHPIVSSPMSWSATPYSVTTTGMQVRAQKASGAAATTVNVYWWASQMGA